jgi:hypothetical protein
VEVLRLGQPRSDGWDWHRRRWIGVAGEQMLFVKRVRCPKPGQVAGIGQGSTRDSDYDLAYNLLFPPGKCSRAVPAG